MGTQWEKMLTIKSTLSNHKKYKDYASEGGTLSYPKWLQNQKEPTKKK